MFGHPFSKRFDGKAFFFLLAQVFFIRGKSGFSLRDFEAFVGIVKLRVNFIPLEQFLDKADEAKALAPHLKDVEYFALALKLGCPIWAQEKAFKKQSVVKVFSTSELLAFLSRIQTQT
ncbi:MAG: hypothetical protein JJE19_08685 [Methanosarcinales archaeon]|nr:hypothetical protein [Methanosarcinales archaeon]